ncbi:MAG TPA: bacteriohopanetetrol glucosamine biosynthesis glycosyltransferase HpnI [Candidatus Tripitaka sp. YC43]
MLISFLKSFFALIVIASIFYYFLSLYCTRKFFRKGRNASSGFASPLLRSGFLPPVTVLKPLNGIEKGLYENLLSHLQQDYPTCQVIFGVRNLDDPAVSVVERLKKELPEKDIELVVSDKIIGSNLKISNLNNMYQRAKYGVIVINDADTRVRPDYLKRVVAPFEDDQVGGTTCLYRTRDSFSFASAIEAFFINGDFLPSVLVANYLGMQFGLGATIAVRRKVLDEIGGFVALANYLADDYEIGNRIIMAGYKLHLCDYLVDVVLQEAGLREYLRHNVRWARTIRSCRPSGYFLRIFTRGTPFSIAFLIVTGFSTWGLTLFFVHLFSRVLTSTIIEVVYLKDTKTLSHLLLLPVKDFITFIVWCWGFAGNKVVWGKNTFYLLEGGKIVMAGPEPERFRAGGGAVISGPIPAVGSDPAIRHEKGFTQSIEY